MNTNNKCFVNIILAKHHNYDKQQLQLGTEVELSVIFDKFKTFSKLTCSIQFARLIGLIIHKLQTNTQKWLINLPTSPDSKDSAKSKHRCRSASRMKIFGSKMLLKTTITCLLKKKTKASTWLLSHSLT